MGSNSEIGEWAESIRDFSRVAALPKNHEDDQETPGIVINCWTHVSVLAIAAGLASSVAVSVSAVAN